MPITDITEAWTAGTTIAATEIWQCTDGKVAISVMASPAVDDGVVLHAGDAVRILAGKTVKLRRIGGSAAKVTREAFE